MTARLETLGSLLAAMAVVAMTGDLPATAEPAVLSESDFAFDLGAKPKVIVPLRRRFSGLFLYSRFGTYRGHHPVFSPSLFLRARFSIEWDPAYTRDLLDTTIMPSSIQIALAMHMAKGDRDLASTLLKHRGSRGINAARHALPFYSGCLPKALWRYPGNADELWYGLRDAMSEAVATLNGGAA